MDKYKKLIYNTFIFGISTFSSKILVFLLLPLYTRILSNADYGVVDLIVQTANLLIPIVSIGVTNGVIRFGLDKSNNSSDVFSTGLFTILGGFIIFLLFEPLLSKIKYISDFTSLIYVFVLMSSLRSLCTQFIRSKQLVRLYAFDGVLSTITTIAFNILYLVVLKLGINGYVLAIISSDFLSVVFLFYTAKLHRYIKLKPKKKSTAKNMLKYSIPLIPSTIFWWITNVSDRYIVAYMLGAEANGLYAISYKIPTIVTLLSSIFIEAWQLSAVSEKDTEYREHFFTNVFKSYASLIFISASGLILLVKIITRILVSEAFYASWQYVPFLIIATTFSCLATFLGSIYFVEKKSNLSLVTTFFGAIVNIILNILLIPKIGVNGAAIATFLSYASVFVLRAFSTKKFVKINWNSNKLFINTVVLLLQSIIIIFELPYWVLLEIFLFIIIILLNSKELLLSVKKYFKK
ncbi:hypothetical protein DSECCO2_509350 [anaerobic digester metagenome]